MTVSTDLAVEAALRSELEPTEGGTLANTFKAPEDLIALGDERLSEELSRLAQCPGEALIVANAYTVCLLHRENKSVSWHPLYGGEFGDKSMEAIKVLLGRLYWSDVDRLPWMVDPSTLTPAPASSQRVRQWAKSAKELTSGRKGEATATIREELAYLASWRCQFSGCGRDLRQHTPTGGRGRFSYYAHIVAASPDGPRGDAVLSPKLASELSNFMLLCDECHRLIDKIDPARFSVDTLRRMREESIGEVRRLLETLQYPSVEVVAILGNVAGQPAQLSIDDVHEALWGSKLRTTNTKVARYFSPGGQHHDVHSGAYWSSLFQQLKRDLPLLQTLLDGTHTGTARPRIAVFPLHATSVLVLAGRVLGDAAGTELLQPHRNTLTGAPRWAWPDDQPIAAANKYQVEVLRDLANEDTACLVVALTSEIEASRMPSECAANGVFGLPTLRIRGPKFYKDCIQHPSDLKAFGNAVDDAMRQLQDEWHVRKVYLFVSAPASAVVVVGQKMQARHHAEYVVHEALPGAGAAYQATIEITPTQVRELVTGQWLFHLLQP